MNQKKYADVKIARIERKHCGLTKYHQHAVKAFHKSERQRIKTHLKAQQ
jgi:hypothetical protein